MSQPRPFRKTLLEETLLISDLFKWTLYATLTGSVIGTGVSWFLKLLHWSEGMNHGQLWLLPIGLFVSSLLVYYLAPDAEGHGTEKVIEAIHKHEGNIRLRVIPVKLLATLVTLGVGGSIGKEGPSAQIGAGLASALAKLFSFSISPRDRKRLVVCGISAGFATVFGTPVAGALFAIEVLFLGRIVYEILYPSFVASITAFYLGQLWGNHYLHFDPGLLPKLNEWHVLQTCLFGLLCGLVALFFIETLKTVEHLFHSLKIWKPAKGLIGGGILALLAWSISPLYLGLGMKPIADALQGSPMPWDAVFWKTIATSLTLATGGSGGVITPLFFLGTSLGNTFAQWFAPEHLAFFSAVGMVAVLAGATNTPLACSVLAMELFGSAIGPYAAAACIASFVIAGYRSVYPSQVLAIEKSSYLRTTQGKTLAESSIAMDVESGKIPALIQTLGHNSRHAFFRHQFSQTMPLHPSDAEPPFSERK
ncbi:voltage-gated chloride channel [bacterium (Candidatus Blackallbacteria) CG17_big_fil_post_rev_8_21_14_2_50_48_46]|uniref:Voltage-gated chloride channel n=1 Tax=bacterium (Candidatus Blackallbacteria) CG17_big_fil_post_rev_8_21_14_2_50_48_46 TaxID=2014261 RepID=A0A2M7FXE6_9BACT|nr:MAG: voltage-gated chloride channel [bacterium (Candidatus Blackallbacteria) CG18_big_fil_WC_8_21_14_2_50_49_26]PIW13815.1 MAG: voltage-gated chloride channel [bacterium (Candidatus Blackallbacteria) CG17_big_fil_post_rev_8_21_14_2_50_48_46]PIW45041.1 MAG: voltage-gated chloride channel [bacterium (Candidatus Blackallbacteria) CG13_big_fil_rev_8_21_14_2_50_49_14]